MFQSISFEDLPAARQQLVLDLRERVAIELPDAYDHNFNFLRWLIAAEKQLASGAPMLLGNDPGFSPEIRKKILDQAESALRHHLRMRKALRLDEVEIPDFDENPMFQRNLSPRGHVSNIDKSNRLMWWMDYRSLDFKGVLHSERSSDMLRYNFYQYEQLLKEVVVHEKITDKFSAIHHIGNLKGYPTNPFTMVFVSNGQMAYYFTLFHYENYPELVNPIAFVNVPRWLYYVYKLIKAMSPVDIFDRFRLVEDPEPYLAAEMKQREDIPDFYGGSDPKSESLRCVPAVIVPETEYYKHSHASEPAPKELIHLRVSARHRVYIPVTVDRIGAKLSWYFKTDGEIFFGLFYGSTSIDSDSWDKRKGDIEEQLKQHSIDGLEMVEPWFRTSAKLVPEVGAHDCAKAGTYFVVFCNQAGWFFRRSVHCQIRLNGEAHHFKHGQV